MWEGKTILTNKTECNELEKQWDMLKEKYCKKGKHLYSIKTYYCVLCKHPYKGIILN